jgi:hypothetical protein
LQNREEAKILLLNLIETSPKLDYEILLEDIYIYPRKAILNLNLEPKTEYTISLKSFSTDI